jgi:hypothetical protein
MWSQLLLLILPKSLAFWRLLCPKLLIHPRTSTLPEYKRPTVGNGTALNSWSVRPQIRGRIGKAIGSQATGAGGGTGVRGGTTGARPAEVVSPRGPALSAGGSGYLARLGGGCQARVNPVVAPYGHHAGADFVAQFQGEHGQHHDGGGSERKAGAGSRRNETGMLCYKACHAATGAKQRATKRVPHRPLAGHHHVLLRLRGPIDLLRLRRPRPAPAASAAARARPVLRLRSGTMARA